MYSVMETKKYNPLICRFQNKMYCIALFYSISNKISNKKHIIFCFLSHLKSRKVRNMYCFSSLPYNICPPYWVNLFIIVGTCKCQACFTKPWPHLHVIMTFSIYIKFSFLSQFLHYHAYLSIWPNFSLRWLWLNKIGIYHLLGSRDIDLCPYFSRNSAFPLEEVYSEVEHFILFMWLKDAFNS